MGTESSKSAHDKDESNLPKQKVVSKYQSLYQQAKQKEAESSHQGLWVTSIQCMHVPVLMGAQSNLCVFASTSHLQHACMYVCMYVCMHVTM